MVNGAKKDSKKEGPPRKKIGCIDSPMQSNHKTQSCGRNCSFKERNKRNKKNLPRPPLRLVKERMKKVIMKVSLQNHLIRFTIAIKILRSSFLIILQSQHFIAVQSNEGDGYGLTIAKMVKLLQEIGRSRRRVTVL